MFGLRTPAPVYPGLKTVLVGFFAAGKAGKASPFFKFAEDWDRLGVGDALAELDAELDVPAAFGAAGRSVSQPGVGTDGAGKLLEGKEGKALAGVFALAAAEPQDRCCPIADLPLCTVELFSFNTLELPIPEPSTPAADVAAAPVGPGRDG